MCSGIFVIGFVPGSRVKELYIGDAQMLPLGYILAVGFQITCFNCDKTYSYEPGKYPRSPISSSASNPYYLFKKMAFESFCNLGMKVSSSKTINANSSRREELTDKLKYSKRFHPCFHIHRRPLGQMNLTLMLLP